ncbi:MAG: L,D-transpeptidase family protein [Cytophagales bacterium]|nr:L,D-transpeptidase family protein [Cytophagales bacterium]
MNLIPLFPNCGKRLLRFIFPVAVLVWLTQCYSGQGEKKNHTSHSDAQNNTQPPETQPIQQQIRQLLDSTLQMAENPTPPFVEQLDLKAILVDFYSERNWEPVWCHDQGKTAQADSALAQLRNARNYGLLPNFYATEALTQLSEQALQPIQDDKKATLLAEWDICLTQSVLQFAGHLRSGRMHPKTLRPEAHHHWINDKGAVLLKQVLEDNRWSCYLTACQPAHGYYRRLQEATARFVQNHPRLDSISLTFADFKRDSLTAFRQLKRQLVQDGFAADFSDTLASSVQHVHLRKALRAFQQSRGLEATGKLDKTTLQALQVSERELFNRLAITLERLRWETFADSTFLLVNIPAYQSYLCRGGDVLLERRVIVGKPDARTPILSSAINYFVIAPEWNVPRSIAVKEMLPRIQRNVNFLASNHLELLDAGKNPVDPYSVQWSHINAGNFPYAIRQQPGCDNALGNILFHFPNRYNFYLHDTPERRLFKRAYRALSHSCIRMDDPADLAEYLLRREHHKDTVTHAMIERCQQKRERRQYNLAYPLPIHIRYYTCGVEQGTLCFYPDVYKMNTQLMQAWLSGK